MESDPKEIDEGQVPNHEEFRTPPQRSATASLRTTTTIMMDVDAQPGQPFTILRIKRKRNEEPLDALVVESRVRKKRSRKGLNVFQFSQTVEEDTWEDEKRRKDLQEQISLMAKARAAEAPASAGAEVEGKPPSPTVSRPQKGAPSRRYTIVKQEEPEDEKPRLPTAPPKVISHKDAAAKVADFKMYDAILSGAEKKKAPSPGFDSDMDKFLPMLSDYLKIHDITPPGSPSLKKPSSSALPAIGKSDDDYVWDVFYHRPATLSEWNAVAANFGTLTGLPPSITNPYGSDSDSEPEDEADEDSNGEEYFTNEYPDEEESSSGSDMFHDGRSDDDDDDLALADDSFDEDEWSRRA